MQYLIDASVYVFRAYYSMPDDMVDDAGNPVNALYGFCRFLGDFMEQVTPEFIAVAFDESLSESFRTEIYPEYKANRKPMPQELAVLDSTGYIRSQRVAQLLPAPAELPIPRPIRTRQPAGRYTRRRCWSKRS